MLDKKLILLGEGKYEKELKEKSTSNIHIFKFQPFNKFHDLMRSSKAFVFAGEEDFGISLVEAQACGIPVIAFEKGGASETIIHKKTGILFKNQSVDDIIGAVREFEKIEKNFNPYTIRNNASRFETDRFHKELSELVTNYSNGIIN